MGCRAPRRASSAATHTGQLIVRLASTSSRQPPAFVENITALRAEQPKMLLWQDTENLSSLRIATF